MTWPVLVFWWVGFVIIKLMIVAEGGVPVFDLAPTFDPPEFPDTDLGDCSGFVDFLQCSARVTVLVFLIAVYPLQVAFEIVVFLVGWLAFMFAASTSPFGDSAPWFITVLTTAPLVIGLILLLFSIIRGVADVVGDAT